MIGNKEWQRYIYTVDIEGSKKVKEVDFELVANDFTGSIQFTDLQFQEGSQISANIPSGPDILSPVSFNIDEFTFLNTVGNPSKRGTQPIYHKDVTNRFYNIVGRGHEVISIPNVFHEDYTFPIVTSALDIELYAKEDFDLLRIRTNDGGFVPDRKYHTYVELIDHPLNYKYTREFYFSGGKAGDKIELKASINAAKINGKSIPMNKHRIESFDHGVMDIDRQRYMLAPSGSFRLGIEFYKQVDGTVHDESGSPKKTTWLEDTGIGYHGTAELNQWTYGVSKL